MYVLCVAADWACDNLGYHAFQFSKHVFASELVQMALFHKIQLALFSN